MDMVVNKVRASSPTTIEARAMKLLVRDIIFEQLLVVILITGQHEVVPTDENLLEIVQYFNEKFQIEFNLFANLNSKDDRNYNDLIAKLDVPKVLIYNETFPMTRDLYKIFNMQILTLARVDAKNFNATLNLLDGLLWRRHFTNMVFIWEYQVAFSSDLLHSFFGECWKRSFTQVVVWCNNCTYTYTPYPIIEVKEIATIYDYEKISHWNNLHQYKISIPIVEFSPRCFSYRNRRGTLIVSGYYYKIIQTFVQHYNGSLVQEFLNVWTNMTQEGMENIVLRRGYSFIPAPIATRAAYSNSDSIGFASSRLIVPSGAEIHQSLYLIIPFESRLWLMVLLLFVGLVVLISLVKQRNSQVRDIAGSVFEALKVIIFISVAHLDRRTVCHFSLHLMFLLTGFFVTNLYCGNLCSMYTSRIYAKDLMTIEDIATIEQKILIYTTDVDVYRRVESLPAIFFERLLYGNNTEFYVNRQKLNMKYIYYGFADLLNFLVFQQRYMRRPFARVLPEILMQDVHLITLPHRSTFIERFNWYLGRIKDGGILQKFLSDTQWDGVMSGVIQFFRDNEINRPLSMAFFQYAFVIWSIGLLAALVCFLYELLGDAKRIIVQIV